MTTLLEAAKSLCEELDPRPWTDSLGAAIRDLRAAIAAAESAPALVTAEEINALFAETAQEAASAEGWSTITCRKIAALVAERLAAREAEVRALVEAAREIRGRWEGVLCIVSPPCGACGPCRFNAALDALEEKP